MKYLGLEVETLEDPLHVSSPLGTKVNVECKIREKFNFSEKG